MFFKGTQMQLIDELAAIMKPVRVKPDELIINIGDDGDGMFVIHSGKVKVHFENLTVAVLSTNDVFGEMAILEATPRTMSVTAIDACELFFINRMAFRCIFNETIGNQGFVNLLITRIKGDNSRTIEEFKKREKELTDLVNQRTYELQQKNEELIRTQKYKEQFLANMSHEIRTPMNAVVGLTNLLLKTEMEPRQMKYLETIKQASDNLLVIINDILDFSKIEAGKLDIEKTNFRLDKVMEGVINTIRHKADEKELKLEKQCDANIPNDLIGDPVRLNQVLLNLAGNAVKFTLKGTITIFCKLLEHDGKTVLLQFSVADTGIGISPEKLSNIFESFSQAEAHTTRTFGGTGLGLSISKQLVELQGGSISVKSELENGSVFSFTIRYPVGEKTEKSSVNHAPVINLENINILLAEDDDFNQMVAKDTLESMINGVNVDIADNGKIAFEKVKINEYDLVLMDVNMPEMDGYETTMQIRQLPAPKGNVKIMAMTASATKQGLQQCLVAGMNDHITKPFKPEDLLAKIAGLLIGVKVE